MASPDIKQKFGFQLGLNLGQLEFVWYLDGNGSLKKRREILQMLNTALRGRADITRETSYKKIYRSVLRLFARHNTITDYIKLGIYAFRINAYLNLSAEFPKRDKLKKVAKKKLKGLFDNSRHARAFNKRAIKNKLSLDGIYHLFKKENRAYIV